MAKMYDYRTIVVGTDGSPLAGPTVARAAWLAAHDDADLVIVCAYSGLSRRDEARNVATLGGDARVGLVTGRADASAALAAAVGVAREQSATISAALLVDGEPANALLATAAEEGGRSHRRRGAARHQHRRPAPRHRRRGGRAARALRRARRTATPRPGPTARGGGAGHGLIAAGYRTATTATPTRRPGVQDGRRPGARERGGPVLQPTMCRLENLPSATALKRMMAAMVELFCDSFEDVPRRIVLDIDDTEDRVHGRQQLALFHAHYDGYCSLPIHVYEAITGKPVAVILRPGKTPTGPR